MILKQVKSNCPFREIWSISTIRETPDKEDEDAEKPQFASLRKGQFIENITLEDAMELFKLPRELGDYEDKKMVAAIGRFGPYIRHDSKFVSIPKGEDPLDITFDRAVELIEEKRKADRENSSKISRKTLKFKC